MGPSGAPHLAEAWQVGSLSPREPQGPYLESGWAGTGSEVAVCMGAPILTYYVYTCVCVRACLSLALGGADGAVSHPMTTPFPSSPQHRPQLTATLPHAPQGDEEGQGHRAGWLLPALQASLPPLWWPLPLSSSLLVSDDRSSVMAPPHSPAVSEQRSGMSWLGARGVTLSSEAGACLPPLPAQDDSGRTPTTSFLGTLVGSWGPRGCLLTSRGSQAMPGGSTQCTWTQRTCTHLCSLLPTAGLLLSSPVPPFP